MISLRPQAITRPPSMAARPVTTAPAPEQRPRRRSRQLGTNLNPVLAEAFALFVRETTPHLTTSAALRQIIRRQLINWPHDFEVPYFTEGLRGKGIVDHVRESLARAKRRAERKARRS